MNEKHAATFGPTEMSSRRLPGIQALRGVAALAVLVHHVCEESTPLLSNKPLPPAMIRAGASGVDIFFAISGFIMLSTTFQKFGEPGAGIQFLTRRFLRIAPLYWLCTLVILGAHASGALYHHLFVSLTSVLGSFFFVDTVSKRSCTSCHCFKNAGVKLNSSLWNIYRPSLGQRASILALVARSISMWRATGGKAFGLPFAGGVDAHL